MRLDHWRLARDHHRLRERADLYREGPYRDAVTRMDNHVRSLESLESIHLHSDGIRVRSDRGKEEIAGGVRDRLFAQRFCRARERYGRARYGPSAGVVYRSRDGSRSNLRPGRHANEKHTIEEQGRGTTPHMDTHFFLLLSFEP